MFMLGQDQLLCWKNCFHGDLDKAACFTAGDFSIMDHDGKRSHAYRDPPVHRSLKVTFKCITVGLKLLNEAMCVCTFDTLSAEHLIDTSR